ncbi:putative disease resistance protein [Abeliophyllum distichum]|uniref:Disease resistance protein n=1 Tax=Abeliophyllum distichum TaxID=126358 RepID=A0ABD1UF71_9LAMI
MIGAGVGEGEWCSLPEPEFVKVNDWSRSGAGVGEAVKVSWRRKRSNMDGLLANFVVQPLLNVKNLKRNTRILKRKLDSLECREADVRAELNCVEGHSGKKWKKEVENWLSNVAKRKGEFESLEQQLQRNKVHQFYSRLNLAEQVVTMTEEVTELVNQGQFSEGLFLQGDRSTTKLLELVNQGQFTEGHLLEGNRRTAKLLLKHNGRAFLQNFNDIWASIDNILTIGLNVMGGVGKRNLGKCAADLNSSQSCP